MLGSLYTGVSGLKANAMAMSIIGDNIANVNTVAFKSGSALFSTMLSQSLEGYNESEIGRGVKFAGSSPLWKQGSLENTASGTDLAVTGRGFFMVQDKSGANYYTRAGQFHFDREGNLVTPDSLAVQGYEIALDGTTGAITNINIPDESTTPPNATTLFSIDLNLDAGAETGDEYTTTITTYDSLGNAIPLTITFTKTAIANQWDWAADTSATGAVVTAGTGTITFNDDGTLPNGTDPPITLTFTNGAADQSITWDLYDGAPGPTNGDVTGYASPSTTTFQTQDGYTSGTLKGIVVDDDGIINGSYSNGQIVPLFQIALADFPSYWGLAKMENNLYAQTFASGQAMIGAAGSGKMGGISSNALETSNVDLTSEFVKMITTQRAYQANSRVITTSDEILSELINMKR